MTMKERQVLGYVWDKSLWEKELEVVAQVGEYATKDDLLWDAFHIFLATRPNLRLEMAIELYRRGEVSMGRAAEIAGLNHFDFDAVLVSREIPKNWPEETGEEIRKGAQLIHVLREQGATSLSGQ